MDLEKKLLNLNEKLAKARQEMDIVGEQLAFQLDVTEEAKERMLVSETPLADREYREARDDLERVRRYYESCREEVEELSKQQEEVFDRLMGRVIRG